MTPEVRPARAALAAALLVAQVALGNTTVVPDRAPAPTDNPTTKEKIALGRQLFFDKRLSATGTVSCHDCHSLVADGERPSGAGRTAVATGIFGRMGTRNVPTVWNAALRNVLFWDGRAGSLEEQARGPLLDPSEMGMSGERAVVEAVEGIEGYREAFQRAFAAERSGSTRITFKEIVKAIAAFERTLLTPGSAFDRFQLGDESALSPAARRGWDKFRSFSCIACHGAPTFTGGDYYVRFPQHPIPDFDYLYGFTRDQGRFRVTGERKDENFFRVPSLRNVAITGPYFHNGAVTQLEQAVRIMGRAQLGRTLADEDVADLVAFLKSLTGVANQQTVPDLPLQAIETRSPRRKGPRDDGGSSRARIGTFEGPGKGSGKGPDKGPDKDPGKGSGVGHVPSWASARHARR